MSEETIPIKDVSSSVEKRLWYLLLISFVLELAGILVLAELRFSAGVLIGGFLAIFNFRFLQTSVRGLLETHSNRFAVRFLLRYAVIVLVILIVSLLKVVPLTGLLLGISSFVVALMAESMIQFYFVLIKHEEV